MNKEISETETITYIDNAAVPEGLKAKLNTVDWSIKDVLVGSLGSVRQFHDNIVRKYYYVPEKHIANNVSDIKYIAIFQSKRFFGNQAGISYYGETELCKKLQRKDISFPLQRNNGDELYYAFRVKKWNKLPVPISVRYETVCEPKFTNYFLLSHCSQSYELFNIQTSDEFVFLHEVKKIYSEAKIACSVHFEKTIKLSTGYSLWLHDNYFDIYNSNGERSLSDPITISDFEKNPGRTFRKICDALNFKRQDNLK